MVDIKRRVLIVDDDGASLLCLKLLLVGEGYIVDTAPDIKSALEAASKEMPDLLVTDIQLPDGCGTEIWQDLMKHKPVPAIALSGYDMETIEQKSDLQFSGYMTKPVDFEKLINLVDELLEAR